MPFLTEGCCGPSIWYLGVVWVQRSVPSVVDRVRSASLSVRFTSRMQRAPIINELHCDLLGGQQRWKRRHLRMRIFRIVASQNREVA